MKRPPKGAKFETLPMKRVDFLSGALARLNDDVGTILNFIEDHNRNSERKIGFWASIRMIMPIIKAIAHVNGESPQNFLGKYLSVNTPHLAWDLFRHSLIHGDYLQHGKFQAKDVSWGVSMFGQGHVVTSGHIGVDVVTLYQKLKEYLENEITKNDSTIINVEVGVIYSTPKTEIEDDFSKL